MPEKTYTQEELNAIAETIALTENTLTFMNLSLQRSQAAGDRPNVYNAGIALYNKLAAPPARPDPAEQDDEEDKPAEE